MDQNLEKRLINEFPLMFRDMYGDPRKTCMSFGIQCGDGWWDLIHNTCSQIQDVLDENPALDFRFLQVKEKFAGLNMYCEGGNKEIYAITFAAEEDSYHVCEQCGTRDDVTTNKNGWLCTLCKKCRK